MAMILVFLLVLITIGGEKKQKTKFIESIENIQGLEDYKTTSEMTTSFSNKIYYEVNSIKWSGETGTASVTVTVPDLQKIIRDCIDQTIASYGADDYDEILAHVKTNIQTVLESDDCPMIDKEVEMETIKREDTYILVSNDEFEKIIQGNLEEIFLKALTEG